MKVYIYTDGSCIKNPGKTGGWAAYMYENVHMRQRLISGEVDEDRVTNNRMELLAVIEALEALKKPCEVIVYTDSELTVKCSSGEYRRNANLDLWERYEKAISSHDVTLEWIKGHDGHPENEKVHNEAERRGRLAHERAVREGREEDVQPVARNRRPPSAGGLVATG